MDWFQKRYIAHQLKKKKVLMKLLKERHSTRVFSEKEIPVKTIDKIVKSLECIPSSCDRKAVSLKLVYERDEKDLLGGLLVGGVGWIHRADKVLLLVANMEAYKEKINYIPYLDAGVMVYHLYMVCHVLGLKCCFVNPNVRVRNQHFFREMFLSNGEVFCGAMALGYK